MIDKMHHVIKSDAHEQRMTKKCGGTARHKLKLRRIMTLERSRANLLTAKHMKCTWRSHPIPNLWQQRFANWDGQQRVFGKMYIWVKTRQNGMKGNHVD